MTIPKTMKAAILVEQRKPLVIDEVELPQILEVGQVLVKIHFSGICGSQLGEIDGAKGEDKFLPHLLGHEASASVMETGPGVKHVKPGDTVVLHWRKGLGIEGAPPKYKWRGIKLNAGWIATFNQYAIVAENRMTSIPMDSNLQVAALFGCAITTGFGIVENDAHLRIGESVVVFGAGGIGLNIVQAASIVGAHPIIAVDLFENRLELARTLGATHVINASQITAQIEIDKILNKKQLDVFIDNTGLPEVIEMGYQITAMNGRLVLVGVPKLGKTTKLFTLPLHFGKKIIGSHGGSAEPGTDIDRYMRFCNCKKINLTSMITKVSTLEAINSTIGQLRDGTISGRCLISFS